MLSSAGTVLLPVSCSGAECDQVSCSFSTQVRLLLLRQPPTHRAGRHRRLWRQLQHHCRLVRALPRARCGFRRCLSPFMPRIPSRVATRSAYAPPDSPVADTVAAAGIHCEHRQLPRRRVQSGRHGLRVRRCLLRRKSRRTARRLPPSPSTTSPCPRTRFSSRQRRPAPSPRSAPLPPAHAVTPMQGAMLTFNVQRTGGLIAVPVRFAPSTKNSQLRPAAGGRRAALEHHRAAIARQQCHRPIYTAIGRPELHWRVRCQPARQLHRRRRCHTLGWPAPHCMHF